MLVPVGLIAIIFITGFAALQKGEIALTRTKTLRGPQAKIIGVGVLISIMMLWLSVLKGDQQNHYGLPR